jgi:hypothetical protein
VSGPGGLQVRNLVDNMKSLMFVIAVGLLSFALFGNLLPSSASRRGDEHTEWIAQSLKEMESVKVGMTRADLLRVFKEEGGISTRTQQRYVYRNCPYIKVDVEFEMVDNVENKIIKSTKDKIVKISKPFLEWSILD